MALTRSVLVFVAWVAFAAFLELGVIVDRFGEPALALAFDRAVVNHGTLVAWEVTQLGRAYVLVPLAVALLIAAWPLQAWRGRILFSLVMLLLCWRNADLFQHLFARPRRLDWFILHETSHSYPSSHAAIAAGFYALWAWLIARSELARPTRLIVAGILGLVAIAICWSRLALGAHYMTDIAGGLLLGLALVVAGTAVWPGIAREAGKERA
ncbi:MAG TPA: phosphatase PAP2 family protein [Candidatus Tyrphobacter sp.]